MLYDYNTHCTYAIVKLLVLSLKGILIMNKEIKNRGLYLHHSKPWKNDGYPTWIIKSHNPRTKNLKYFLGLHLTGTTSSKEEGICPAAPKL